MNNPYRLTSRAVGDLDNIWDFIAQDDPLAADKFDVALRLTTAPRMGRQRDDLQQGLRSVPHGNYLILYTLHGDVVEICRFLHGGRDIKAQFEDS